jgi:hypothetical protein
VNQRILGGWKYVKPNTGRFFTDENDVTGAVSECLNERFSPRTWFCATHGPENAASRLATFLRTVADCVPATANGAAG